VSRLVLLLLAGALAGCWSGPTTGPDEIKWDRQTCERCQMVISERPHAAQIRFVGERRAHAFDDLGCALIWLAARSDGQDAPQVEVWVRDAEDERWIDGLHAHYGRGRQTPMQYGWAVADQGVSLDEVQSRVREAERQRHGEASQWKIRSDGSGG